MEQSANMNVESMKDLVNFLMKEFSVTNQISIDCKNNYIRFHFYSVLTEENCFVEIFKTFVATEMVFMISFSDSKQKALPISTRLIVKIHNYLIDNKF